MFSKTWVLGKECTKKRITTWVMGEKSPDKEPWSTKFRVVPIKIMSPFPSAIVLIGPNCS